MTVWSMIESSRLVYAVSTEKRVAWIIPCARQWAKARRKKKVVVLLSVILAYCHKDPSLTS